MTATTPRGYPYPENTDPVTLGADAIRDLALAVDGKAVQQQGNGLTLRWQAPTMIGNVDGAVDVAIGSTVGSPVYAGVGYSGTDGNGYLSPGVPEGYQLAGVFLARDNEEGIAFVLHANGYQARAFATSNNVPAANYAGPWLFLFIPRGGQVPAQGDVEVAP